MKYLTAAEEVTLGGGYADEKPRVLSDTSLAQVWSKLLPSS